MASNITAQGLNIVMGRQESFDWRSVALSAASADLTQGLKLSGFAADTGNFGRDLAAGLVQGTAKEFIRMAIYKDGKFNFAAVATDAFGNALGESIVDALKPKQGVGPYSSPDYRNGSDIDSDNYAPPAAGPGLKLGRGSSGLRFPDSAVTGWNNDLDRGIKDKALALSDWDAITSKAWAAEDKAAAAAALRQQHASADAYSRQQALRDQQGISQSDAIFVRRVEEVATTVSGGASTWDLRNGSADSQGAPALDPRYEARLARVLSDNTANSVDDFTTRRHLAVLDAKIGALNGQIAGLYGNDAGLRGALAAERSMYERAKSITLSSSPRERAEALAVGKVLGLAPTLDAAEARSLVDQWRNNRLNSANPLHREIHASLLEPRVTRGLLGVDAFGYDGGAGPGGILNMSRGFSTQTTEVSYFGRTGFGFTNSAEDWSHLSLSGRHFLGSLTIPKAAGNSLFVGKRSDALADLAEIQAGLATRNGVEFTTSSGRTWGMHNNTIHPVSGGNIVSITSQEYKVLSQAKNQGIDNALKTLHILEQKLKLTPAQIERTRGLIDMQRRVGRGG